MKYVGAIDQGTTSSRFILFDGRGRPVCSHQLEHSQIQPRPGWVEHDPEEILDRVRTCVDRCMEEASAKGVSASDVAAVGVTNQRETLVVWDRATGKPLHNAVVWLDTRTAGTAAELERRFGGTGAFRAVTGLPISTYFSAVKLVWLRDNVPAVRDALAAGTACAGTVDSWLIYSLTRERAFVTDVTNASRTMMMDLATCSWHVPTCEALGVDPAACLARIASSSEEYGRLAGGALDGVPVCGALGDQQAATLGHRCVEGEAKNTYGTGCFTLLHTGPKLAPSAHGLLTTALWKLGPGAPTQYALEGSVAIAGAGVSWLRDRLGIITSAQEVEELAGSVPDTAGVCFVPALGGLLAPRWRPDARGTIVGLTQYSSKAHVARAMLEAICMQTQEVLEAMAKDWGAAAGGAAAGGALKVDGGASANDLLMQMQADLAGRTVFRPSSVETTALGAALAAGLAAGVWSHGEVFSGAAEGTEFAPVMAEAERARRRRRWDAAVERSLRWAEYEDGEEGGGAGAGA